MKLVRRLLKQSDLIALRPGKLVNAWRGLFSYLNDKSEFYAQYLADGEQAFAPGELYPCLSDRFESGGAASGHYFHQDLLVAQMIFRNNPQRHVDVGSRVDGFVAHVAAFRHIDVFDIRQTSSSAANIFFHHEDIMSAGPKLAECTDSLSCLHTLEHFGLGRYGDPIDYRGYQKGFDILTGMLKPGGLLYLSVPISRDQRFEFNAHRVFSLRFLLTMFETQRFRVQNLSFVDDQGELHANVGLHSPAAERTFDLNYGCGISLCANRQDLRKLLDSRKGHPPARAQARSPKNELQSIPTHVGVVLPAEQSAGIPGDCAICCERSNGITLADQLVVTLHRQWKVSDRILFEDGQVLESEVPSNRREVADDRVCDRTGPQRR